MRRTDVRNGVSSANLTSSDRRGMESATSKDGFDVVVAKTVKEQMARKKSK